MKPQSVFQIGFQRWTAFRRKVRFTTMLPTVAGFFLATTSSPASTSVSGFGNLPISFEENRGQAEGKSLFIARGSAYRFSLSSTEATVSLGKSESASPKELLKEGRARANPPLSFRSLQLAFLGANPAAKVSGERELAGRVNYFIGANAADWRTGLPLFERVRVREMYPGVDLVHYGNQQHLEYDFEIAPGADPTAIGIRFSGADSIAISPEGELVIKLGDDEIRQPKPLIYQNVGECRREVAGSYVLTDSCTVKFSIGNYDRNLPLVIDPVLSYSTYYGGGGIDNALAVTVGADGYVYVAGGSMGGLPTTVGSRTNRYSGANDAFVAKFDQSGSNVIYLSYIGGSSDEVAFSVAVDGEGSAYVTGWTDSSNFPRTNALFNQIKGIPNPPPLNDYPADVFVTKLGPSGTNLVYSTYLGSSGVDVGLGITVDSTGNAYVAGYTQSTNFPTANVYGSFTKYNGGYLNDDAFVTKIGPAGTNLIYSMYLGGTNLEHATDIAADAGGLAYVVGFTSSTNFPTTNAIQPWLNGDSDLFVTVVGPFGSNLVSSTFLGGVETNIASRLVLDGALNVYITGATYGDPAYPITPSVLNPGGVFRSGNGAATWSSANNGLQSVVGLSLAIDPVNPARMYVGTSRGIARSTDSGATWNTAISVATMPRIANLGPTIALGAVVSVAIDPLQPATVYASTGQGVFKSTDSGASWVLRGTNFNALASRTLVVDPILPQILYCSGDAGVFRSTDGATNWLSVNNGLGNLSVRALAMNPTTPATLYAATAGGVYRTTNRGTNWSVFNNGLTNLSAQALAIDPVTPAKLYVGTATGVFASTNAGSNWFSVSVGLTSPNVLVLAINPTAPTTLYAGTTNGLFKSTDSGSNWVARSAGLVVTEIASLAINPQSPEILYTGTRGLSFFGGSDVFVTKLGNNGFSAVYGGSGNDEGFDLAVRPSGRVYVVGTTLSTNFPVLFPAGFLRATNSGARDVFLSQLSADGGSLLSSAYLGGASDEWGNGIALDTDENIYLVGQTKSANFPTLGALQGQYRGSSDAFIAKISSIDFNPFLSIQSAGGNVQLSWSALASGYPLQSNPNLQTAGGWTNVPVTPVQSNGLLSVSLPATNAAQFFRLSNP